VAVRRYFGGSNERHRIRPALETGSPSRRSALSPGT
jgi:hypothetical protein